MRCGGSRHGSDDATLARVGAPTATAGVESPGRGAFVALSQAWSAANCPCALETSVRYYADYDSFEFLTSFAAAACNGTAAAQASGPSSTDTLASEFPALRLVGDGLPGLVNFNNGDLGPAEHLFRAPVAPDLAQFAPLAGMDAGLALLFSPSPPNASAFAPALALGLANHFLSASLSRTSGGALAFGVNGYATSVPAGFSLSVSLAARGGANAAALAWGEAVRAQHQTARTTLDEDALSSRLGYMNDDGAYYCFCEYTDRHLDGWPGRRPAGEILVDLQAYHASLGLRIGTYHLDPYW